MREFSVENSLKKIFKKLLKKDKETFDILMNKIRKILNCNNINHYKNLRKPLHHLKRVHIKGSFILTFKYSESENKVIFYDFDHHDKIYK